MTHDILSIEKILIFGTRLCKKTTGPPALLVNCNTGFPSIYLKPFDVLRGSGLGKNPFVVRQAALSIAEGNHER